MSYNKALNSFRKKYASTEPTKQVVFICQYCEISKNTATKYKVLKCNKSANFNKTHSFIEYSSFIKQKRIDN